MRNIILFGTGFIGKKVFHFLQSYNISVKFWIDSNLEKQGKTLYGLYIYGPEQLCNVTEDFVCIALKDTKNEVKDSILFQGVPENMVIGYATLMIQILEQYLPIFNVKFSGKKEKRKIILDCTSGLGLGGVEAWSVELLEQMMTEGYDAYIIAPFGEYQISENVRRKTIFVELNVQDSFSRHNIENLYQTLQEYSPCIIISKSIDDLVYAVCTIKNQVPSAVRLLSVIHQGMDTVYKENSDISKYVDRYIAVSEDIMNGMIMFGISSDRVLHMTCPVTCSQQLCREYSIDKKDEIKLGYAGRIVKPQKRMDLLLKVIELLEKWQCRYMLEIAGDGGFLEDIRRFIWENQLEARIKILGRIDRSEIPDFWRRQDICVNIADHEGRSISIMEAMANGAIPVVTATSGVREDIIDSVNGFIVDVGDYKAMADKIQYLSENRQELYSMGSKTHDMISQKCNMEQHMIFWKQVLSNI